MNVKFYTIFFSFIRYLCSKAASFQLLINEYSSLLIGFRAHRRELSREQSVVVVVTARRVHSALL